MEMTGWKPIPRNRQSRNTSMFGVMGAAVPKDFQGGEADGAIKELV
jgi:hypothetical protein